MSNLRRNLGLGLMFLVVFNIAKTVVEQKSPASPSSEPIASQESTKSQESEEQKTARLKAELQEKAEILAVRDMVERTYQSMRDKRSMEILKAKTDVKDKRLSACMVFSAKNGFGGVNEGQAVWYITAGKSDGRFAIDQPAIWNRHCNGAGGTIRTGEAKEMLAYLRAQ